MGFLEVLQHDAFLAAVGITLVRHGCFNAHLTTDGLPKRQALEAKTLVFESL